MSASPCARVPLTPDEYRKLAAPKREKYKRAAVEDRTWNGIVYDSKREMEIAFSLDLFLKQGVYKRVDRQVRYPLHVAGQQICTLVIDFRVTHADGSLECIEVKGYETPVWKLKQKLFKALYPKTVLRVVK